MEEFKDVFQLLVEIFAVAMPTGIIVWICYRTRSWHVLRNYVWRILLVRTKISDPDISQFIADQNDLMVFRFISGIRSLTLPQAKRLIEWCKLHDEDIGDVSICKDLFDPEKCCLREEKILKPWRRTVLGLFPLVLCLGLEASIIGVVIDRAAYKFTESGTWFLLSENDARSLSGNVKLTKETCADSNQAPGAVFPYSGKETQIICKTLNTANIKNGINENVKIQRIAFSMLIVMLVWLVFICGFSLRCHGMAARMKKRLEERLKKMPPLDNSD
jgi:hypothetical protein